MYQKIFHVENLWHGLYSGREYKVDLLKTSEGNYLNISLELNQETTQALDLPYSRFSVLFELVIGLLSRLLSDMDFTAKVIDQMFRQIHEKNKERLKDNGGGTENDQV